MLRFGDMFADVSGLLTIIITTSPTPSTPSTELLSSVFTSFHLHCPGLFACAVIVVFDSYDCVTSKARLKKGQVTAEVAQSFEAYKENVKRLVLREWNACDNDIATEDHGEAEYGSEGDTTNAVQFKVLRFGTGIITFIEPSQRLGFGLAVRSALRMVDTPYAWVHQHDWTLVADIPVASMIAVMETHNCNHEVPIKYICLPSIRMLSYAAQYAVTHFPALKAATTMLKGSYSPPSQAHIEVPLTPLFFWHDKPHLASVEHYLNRVFPSRLAMHRGAFIEDTIGQQARNQMKAGHWRKWACWLYYPDNGTRLCLKHLHGRVWRGVDGELKQKQLKIRRNIGGVNLSQSTRGSENRMSETPRSLKPAE